MRQQRRRRCRPGGAVEDREGADRHAVGQVDRHAGIEAGRARAPGDGQVREPRVEGKVADHQARPAGQGAGHVADGLIEGNVLHLEADAGLEPQSIAPEQRQTCDWSVEQVRCQRRQPVEARLCRRVQHPQRVDGAQSGSFVGHRDLDFWESKIWKFNFSTDSQ